MPENIRYNPSMGLRTRSLLWRRFYVFFINSFLLFLRIKIRV